EDAAAGAASATFPVSINPPAATDAVFRSVRRPSSDIGIVPPTSHGTSRLFVHTAQLRVRKTRHCGRGRSASQCRQWLSAGYRGLTRSTAFDGRSARQTTLHMREE